MDNRNTNKPNGLCRFNLKPSGSATQLGQSFNPRKGKPQPQDQVGGQDSYHNVRLRIVSLTSLLGGSDFDRIKNPLVQGFIWALFTSPDLTEIQPRAITLAADENWLTDDSYV